MVDFFLGKLRFSAAINEFFRICLLMFLLSTLTKRNLFPPREDLVDTPPSWRPQAHLCLYCPHPPHSGWGPHKGKANLFAPGEVQNCPAGQNLANTPSSGDPKPTYAYTLPTHPAPAGSSERRNLFPLGEVQNCHPGQNLANTSQLPTPSRTENSGSHPPSGPSRLIN